MLPQILQCHIDRHGGGGSARELHRQAPLNDSLQAISDAADGDEHLVPKRAPFYLVAVEFAPPKYLDCIWEVFWQLDMVSLKNGGRYKPWYGMLIQYIVGFIVARG